MYMVHRKFTKINIFGMSEIFSFMSYFALSLPAKMVCAFTVSSKFETITFLDGVFSIYMVWYFVCQKDALLCSTNDCIILFFILLSSSRSSICLMGALVYVEVFSFCWYRPFIFCRGFLI